MRFLFRLDLSLHAGAEKKNWILNLELNTGGIDFLPLSGRKLGKLRADCGLAWGQAN